MISNTKSFQNNKGSSVNDVTVVWERGVNDFVTIILSNKNRDDEGRGSEKYPKLRNVIY
jgi:hypothetical protein